MARYPSAVGGEFFGANFMTSVLIWNEYTSGAGGGQYGGRPLYTTDDAGYGGQNFAIPPKDINSCVTACDPPDNWVGCPTVSDNSGVMELNIVFNQWTHEDPPTYSPSANRWLYRKNSAYAFDDAYLLFNEDDLEIGYISNALIDINDEGIGYSAVSGYFNGVVSAGLPLDSAHTFLIRKTTDYGATWSGEDGTGMNNTDYYYIPQSVLISEFFDSGLLPSFFIDTTIVENDTTYDTTLFVGGPFIAYDIELKTDPSGGLHLFSAVIPSTEDYVYPAIDEGCGFYHFYSSDPSDPYGWEISLVVSTQKEFLYESDGGSSNWQNIYPSVAISVENEDIMYCTWYAYSDTTQENFNSDIYIARSEDGGVTWSDPQNITNTIALDVDEIDPHLAPRATDEVCYVVYMSPDYETPTVDPPDVGEDYKNRLWFAKVSGGYTSVEGEEGLPTEFSLSQNFPNPFNPQTVISYSLDRTADVRLEVFDLLGRKVQTLVNKEMDAGNHDVVWKGSEQGAGIYFYRLSTDGRSETRKMVLLK